MDARGTVTVDASGRLVIPAPIRQAMGLEGTEELVMTVDNGILTLISKRASRQAARDAVKHLLEPNISWSQELLDERRLNGD